MRVGAIDGCKQFVGLKAEHARQPFRLRWIRHGTAILNF